MVWFFSAQCVKFHWWNDSDPAVVSEASQCRLRVSQCMEPVGLLTHDRKDRQVWGTAVKNQLQEFGRDIAGEPTFSDPLHPTRTNSTNTMDSKKAVLLRRVRAKRINVGLGCDLLGSVMPSKAS